MIESTPDFERISMPMVIVLVVGVLLGLAAATYAARPRPSLPDVDVEPLSPAELRRLRADWESEKPTRA